MDNDSRGSINFIIAFIVLAALFNAFLLFSNITCDSEKEGSCVKDRTMLIVFTPICIGGIAGGIYFINKLKNPEE